MASVNKVILVGNLGADPEIRHLSNGATVANFSLATSESYTNRAGERVTQTEWHRIELWEGLAKIAEQYLKKGRSVYIEGKLKYETWQDQDGNSRTTTRIRGLSMVLLGGRSDDYSSSDDTPSPQREPAMSKNDINPDIQQSGDDDLDDLPF